MRLPNFITMHWLQRDGKFAVERIHRTADPSDPQAIREALWAGVSPPVFLGEQYAVLMMVPEIEADEVQLEGVRPQLKRQVRLNRQRILMDQRARRLQPR